MVNFCKMHALGNDFMVIDSITQPISIKQLPIASLANRHTGVGFDQLLLLAPASYSAAAFKYRIFNADGHEVDQCINGIRSCALYLFNKKLIAANQIFSLITNQQIISVKFSHPEQIQIYLNLTPQLQINTTQLFNQPIKYYYIEIGNPHVVIFDNSNQSLNQFNLVSIAKKFEQVNLTIAKVNNQNINMRIYERGVGETLACGSAACAAVICAKQTGLTTANDFQINMPGGKLSIAYPTTNKLIITGNSKLVYHGNLVL